jgi:signal peptidase I
VTVLAWTIPAAALVALGWLLRRSFVLVHVTGESMAPTLREGDRLLVRRVGVDAVPCNALVVFALPALGPRGTVQWPETSPGGRRWMVKRATGIPGDALPEDYAGPVDDDVRDRVVPPGKLFVLGDNPAVSTDSRRIGCVPASHLLGTVIRRI